MKTGPRMVLVGGSRGSPLAETLKLIEALREYEMAGVEAAESMQQLTYALEQKGRPKKVAQWKQDPRSRFRV